MLGSNKVLATEQAGQGWFRPPSRLGVDMARYMHPFGVGEPGLIPVTSNDI